MPNHQNLQRRQPQRRKSAVVEALQRNYGPALLDRSRPLPDDLNRNLERAINVLGGMLLIENDEAFNELVRGR